MFQTILKKVLGTKHQRELKKLRPLVSAINDREAAIKLLSDAELRAQTNVFRERIDNGASVDDLLVDAFAVVPRGRRPPSACATTTCSSSAASCSIRGASRR
jgi:preprotein translocase subunit SecA